MYHPSSSSSVVIVHWSSFVLVCHHTHPSSMLDVIHHVDHLSPFIHPSLPANRCHLSSTVIVICCPWPLLSTFIVVHCPPLTLFAICDRCSLHPLTWPWSFIWWCPVSCVSTHVGWVNLQFPEKIKEDGDVIPASRCERREWVEGKLIYSPPLMWTVTMRCIVTT